MHEDVKCLDPLPVKILLEQRLLMVSYLDFSQLFRKFCTAEVYSEVVKNSEEFILTLMEVQNDSLEVGRRALGDILLQWRRYK